MGETLAHEARYRPANLSFGVDPLPHPPMDLSPPEEMETATFAMG